MKYLKYCARENVVNKSWTSLSKNLITDNQNQKRENTWTIDKTQSFYENHKT